MKILKQVLHETRGSVAVMAAAMMLALTGMAALVADVGFLYVTHNQLENMTDAGALAGAQEYFFDQTQTVAVATDYALQKNGKPGDTVSVQVDTTNKKVIVTASRSVDLFFAKVFGLDTTNVTAVSAAKIEAISGTSNVCPFAITWDNNFLPTGSAAGNTFTLKVDEKGEFKGNFHSVRLTSRSGGDSGANVLAENIVYGCGQLLKTGDQIKTEPGNKVGPIRKAITDRLAIDGGNIVIIPFIEETWTDLGGGVQLLTIKGFGAFDISSSTGKTVTGRFIELVSGPGEILSNGESLYGLYGTRLVTP